MRKAEQTGGRPTIESVQRQFSGWRREREAREKIPEDLWAAAARLTKEHSIDKVSRSLRLNHTDLKKHAALANRQGSGPKQHAPAFVELDISSLRQAAPEYTVEMEDAEGRKMRICVNGARGMDVLDFASKLWNWQR